MSLLVATNHVTACCEICALLAFVDTVALYGNVPRFQAIVAKLVLSNNSHLF